jgi:serine/threonine protein kinase
LKVLDFGIAKVMSAQGDMTATELGTPAYRAPEQLAPMFKQLARGSGVNIASNVSSATDVWALALAVYECLTGHAACQVWSVQSVQELSLRVLQPAPVPSRIAGAQASLLPRGFDSWLSWCVERDASRRCQRASEAVAALEALYAAASEQPSEQLSAMGTSLGAKVPSYHPDKAPDMHASRRSRRGLRLLSYAPSRHPLRAPWKPTQPGYRELG